MTEASTSKSSTSTQVPDPKFILYLFNPARVADCYLLVGNPKISQPEKIGVVHEMLSAHSEVLRADLQSLNIKEKKPIKIKDISPNTFKILLRYVYGFDTTATLTFDDADNLLYAAEKYIMTELKDKVATRLISLLNYGNICSLLNNPACYQSLALNAQITEILEIETKKVFQSPLFLDLTDDAFVKILEKKSLNIKEIDIWLKAIEWAKHKAKRDDGVSVRTELVKPLKSIRLCTLPAEEFCQEVVPTGVLTAEEVRLICLSRGSKQKQSELVDVCNEIKTRAVPCRKRQTILNPEPKQASNQVSTRPSIPTPSLKRKRKAIFSELLIINGGYIGSQYTSFMIEIKDKPIVLEKLVIYASSDHCIDDVYYEKEASFNVYVEKIGQPNKTVSAHFQSLTPDLLRFHLPISSQLQDFTLSPYSKYKISVACDKVLPARTSMFGNHEEHYSLLPCLNEEQEHCYFVCKIEHSLF